MFDSSKANISEHIKNIITEGELDAEAVVRKFRTTASDGKIYMMQHYNLISKKDADQKAEIEYKKYQAASLAPVEKAYLNSVKMLEKKVKSDKMETG